MLRRVALAHFLAGCAQAVGAVALTLGIVLLALRFAGVPVVARAWWVAAAAVVPMVGFWRARRTGWDAAAASAWLDRQHAMGGLLITGLERDLAAWRQPLLDHLARIPELPLPRVRPLLVRSLPALLFLAAVLLLPALVPVGTAGNPAIEQAIEELQHKVELVQEKHVLDPRQAEQLKAELERLLERNAAGEPVTWSELDGLAARLQHELQDSAMEASKARAQLSELAQAAAPRADAGKALAEVLAQLSAAGLLAGLPKDLAEQAAQALSAQTSSLTPEQAKALAQALSEALAQGLGEFAELGRADLAQLAALDPAALAAARLGQTVDGHVHTELCPGGT
jgi:hypothetical protein